MISSVSMTNRRQAFKGMFPINLEIQDLNIQKLAKLYHSEKDKNKDFKKEVDKRIEQLRKKCPSFTMDQLLTTVLDNMVQEHKKTGSIRLRGWFF